MGTETGKTDLVQWLVLNRFSIENLRGWTKLWKSLGSVAGVFGAGLEEFHAAGLNRLSFQKMRRLLPVYREEAEKEAGFLADRGFGALTLEDDRYPSLLKNIYDPAFVLYYAGDADLLNGLKTVAVVGSRMASVYGRSSARKIARDLAGQGILIVSGGAAGIDTEAHLGALEAGPTVAVLGSGIDVAYPRENAGLFGRIRDRGAVVTEFPPGTPPDRYNFPRRNRIISGLSLGVVIVEAAKRSGSLITANFAAEQGRDVFAVPGEIGAHFSEGANNLIKQGGRLVDSALDILEALELGRVRPQDPPPEAAPAGTDAAEPELSALERAVLDAIGTSVITVDAILAETSAAGHAVKDVEGALLMLELKDLVKQEIGKRFKRL